MRNSWTFFFLILLASCSVQNSIDKEEFDAVIAKYGEEPSKNTAEENVIVAEAYQKSNRLVESIPFYKEAIKQGTTDESAFVYLAHGLKAEQKYEEAKIILDKYIPRAKDSHMKKLAEKELHSINNIDDLHGQNSYYRIKNLSDINTASAEYSPVYSNNYLYFTSNRDGGKVYKTTGTHFTDIYRVATRGANVNLATLNPLDPVINHFDTNEGSIAIMPGGNSIIFAKGNNGKATGYSNVHLFFSRFRNGKWSNPVPLSINDADAWDSTPALSPDGKTLYFSSDRSGGFGGNDLYSAKINRRGRWVDVRNLGPEINTPGDEQFPFVSSDGTLYFSSNGHHGLGHLDIFRAVRQGGRVNIENLGKPMNSHADDFGYFEFNLTRGFITSNRKGGQGDDDIYTFVNDDPNLKVVNYFLTGTTFTTDDAGQNIILPNTKVSLAADNGDIIDEAFTGDDGRFNFRVYTEEHYNLIGEKTDYFTTRKEFTTIGETVDKSTLTEFITNVNFETDILMDRIVIEKAIALKNIYYDLDKADIRTDAALVLDSLVLIMNDNPEIYIELGSHTDDRADDNYNLDLSRRRAISAVRYIISEGIEPERITAKGYGESQLLIPKAKDEAEHQQNRRTEFKVLKYNPRNRNDNQAPDEEADEYDRFFKDSDKGNE
jgi:outer membrane protein OmpA-like peptidoglycan-associated protein